MEKLWDLDDGEDKAKIHNQHQLNQNSQQILSKLLQDQVLHLVEEELLQLKHLDHNSNHHPWIIHPHLFPITDNNLQLQSNHLLKTKSTETCNNNLSFSKRSKKNANNKNL